MMASFVLHLFVLTAVFTLPDTNNTDEQFKIVRVKLGGYENKIINIAASPNELSAFEPSAGAGKIKEQELSGSEETNIPAIEQIPASAQSQATVINNDENVKPDTKKLAGNKDEGEQEKTVISENNKTVETKKVEQQIAKKDSPPAPQPTIKRAEEHWDETGILIGNSSQQSAGKLSSYEQMLPLWLEKFKKYPDEALEQNITGNGELFIKIDRKGKVLLAKVIKTTNYPILDRAIMNMISAADPVLPVPLDYYPDRKTFSYKIAIAFDGP